MEKYESRNDVPLKYKWDLTEFFKSEEEFNKTYEEVINDIQKLNEYKDCVKDADKLYEFLKLDINTDCKLERLYIYAYLINDQELGNSNSMERKNKCENLMNMYFVNISFFAPSLLKLDKDEYNNLFIKNSKLNEFKKNLDDIYKSKDHILSEKEENMISTLLNAMNHFDDMSSTMLNSEHDYGTINIDGKDEVITSTNYGLLMKNEDREIRKRVRENFFKVINNYAVSSSQFLNSFVNANLEVSKMHNFKNAWDNKLFNLEMDNKAFDALVDSVENNVSLLHKYFKLFRETLGFDKLYNYDLNMNLAKSNKEYSIEDAWDITLKAVKPLGDDYVKHFKKIIDDRHIDYAEYKGKCSGGYCYSPTDSYPRILMSYNYNLESISTIIHEGGHDVHHQYVMENNPAQSRGVSTIVSEVASLTNECLLSSYLAKNGEDKNEKLAGIANILSVIVSNLFGAVREGKMETEFYNYVEDGNFLTKDYMNELTKKSLEKYYGNEVVLDDNAYLSWVRRSHYYMNYYLYSYAFSISVASYVAREILAGNKDMLSKYLKFLSTGSDKNTMEAISILGIDLTKEDVYLNALKYFEDMMNEFIKISKEVI